ncbi:MAG: transcriptional regulator [Proteobacteria bacterium]|nr:transcriptional regulator [Pseudomonadota bacterium]
MAATGDLTSLIEAMRAALLPHAAAAAQPYLAHWPHAHPSRERPAVALPVLGWLGTAVAGAPAGVLRAVAEQLAALATSLEWRRSYSEAEAGARFLERYGYCELAGERGPVPSSALSVGFLLLGPETLYPAHRHPAQELYLPISGIASWQQGGTAFRERAPGDAIVHGVEEPHAMRTGAAPLLALYLWRGPGRGQTARLDAAPLPGGSARAARLLSSDVGGSQAQPGRRR